MWIIAVPRISASRAEERTGGQLENRAVSSEADNRIVLAQRRRWYYQVKDRYPAADTAYDERRSSNENRCYKLLLPGRRASANLRFREFALASHTCGCNARRIVRREGRPGRLLACQLRFLE